jgi:hypothetical protein
VLNNVFRKLTDAFVEVEHAAGDDQGALGVAGGDDAKEMPGLPRSINQEALKWHLVASEGRG